MLSSALLPRAARTIVKSEQIKCSRKSGVWKSGSCKKWYTCFAALRHIKYLTLAEIMVLYLTVTILKCFHLLHLLFISSIFTSITSSALFGNIQSLFTTALWLLISTMSFTITLPLPYPPLLLHSKLCRKCQAMLFLKTHLKQWLVEALSHDSK